MSLCDRSPSQAQIDHLLGDFSSLLLLAWQPDGLWRSSARQLQQRLHQDLQHRDVSAFWIMRQLARQRPACVGMPVVFTCGLGSPLQDFLSQRSCFRPQWGISQAPQTWLDHQVYESQDELCFNWDAVQALFAPDVLCAMFDQYVALLERLAQDPLAWNLPLCELIMTPPPGSSAVQSVSDGQIARSRSVRSTSPSAPQSAPQSVVESPSQLAVPKPQHTMRRCGRTGHLGRGGRGRRNTRSGPGSSSFSE